MSNSNEEIKKRLIELLLDSMERELTPAEITERRDLSDRIKGPDGEEEIIDINWLGEKLKTVYNINQEEAWKKVQEAIKKPDDK